MQVKLFYSILLSLGLCFAAQAQKVVVIDTLYELDKYVLISPVGIYQATMPIGYLCNGKNGDAYLKSFIADKTDHHIEYKNGEVVESRYKVVMVIDVDSFCDSDFELLLCMDDKGSGLRIQHIDEYPNDTIRIAKWQMFRNMLVDSVSSVTGINGYVNGELHTTTKVLTEGTHAKSIQDPDTIKVLTINIDGRQMPLSLDVVRKEIRSTSQGLLLKKDIRIYKRYSRYRGDMTKKRFKYLMYDKVKVEYNYYYEAVLDLSKMNADE